MWKIVFHFIMLCLGFVPFNKQKMPFSRHNGSTELVTVKGPTNQFPIYKILLFLNHAQGVVKTEVASTVWLKNLNKALNKTKECFHWKGQITYLQYGASSSININICMFSSKITRENITKSLNTLVVSIKVTIPKRKFRKQEWNWNSISKSLNGW